MTHFLRSLLPTPSASTARSLGHSGYIPLQLRDPLFLNMTFPEMQKLRPRDCPMVPKQTVQMCRAAPMLSKPASHKDTGKLWCLTPGGAKSEESSQ